MKVTDKITITNEDNMALMARYPDNYFDLAIVDPPYGIDVANMTMGSNKDKQWKRGKLWDKLTPTKEYFDELKRVSKNQIIWGANYLGLKGGAIVWNKLGKDIGRRNPAPSFSHCEIAFCSSHNTVKMFSHTYIGNVQGNDYQIKWSSEKKIHPTQKPVKLYEWLLDNYAKEGNKILDTHLGSGSIAIACHNRKFDLTACELDKEYFDKAIKRIKQHTAQQTIFDLGA
jgi:site-specific DNA-methyltransferase (adenine-specific)